MLQSTSQCYRAWLSSDHRSELASPIVFSATATEHGCELIAWIDYEDARNLAATKIGHTNTAAGFSIALIGAPNKALAAEGFLLVWYSLCT